MSAHLSQQPPQQVLQRDDQLTATLEAQEWNVVLHALHELPLNHQGSLGRARVIGKLQQQLERQPIGNGEAH